MWLSFGPWRSVRANSNERDRLLPGDDFIPAPVGVLTHGITIAAAPTAVWPWLAQMGAGSRAGWYSYDALDNGGRRSASQLMPELQDIAVGTVFPAAPGVTDGFVVVAFESVRWLVLGWPHPNGPALVTWAFVLEGHGDSTRLLVRARVGEGYRFRGLPQSVSVFVAASVHRLMERKQLLGIARRVESRTESVPGQALEGRLDQRRSG